VNLVSNGHDVHDLKTKYKSTKLDDALTPYQIILKKECNKLNKVVGTLALVITKINLEARVQLDKKIKFWQNKIIIIK
jgi:hypothetical protein